jgi:hypothetical protein
MIKIETADQKEVRRFRIAQFNGRTATARHDGSTVPPRWTITLIPMPPKVAPAARVRLTPSAHALAEDYF